MTASMTPKFIMMMALNGFGVITYLALASRCWIEPELADVAVATGGAAMVWFATAVPVLVVFFILDALWVSFAVQAYLKTKTRTLHPAFGLVLIIWAAAIYLDFSRHGI